MSVKGFRVKDGLTSKVERYDYKSLDNLPSIDDHYLNINFSDGAQPVPSASDYDTLMTPGNYYVSTSSYASAMTNCPVTVAHRLYVITTTAPNRCLQLVITNSISATDPPQIYKRFYFNSWTPWLRLVDESDVDGLRDRLLQKPILRNGSIGNKSNTNAICSRYTIPTNGADSVTVFFGLEFTYGCHPTLKKFSQYTKDQQSDSATNVIVNYDTIPSDIISFNSVNSCTIDVHDCEAFAIGVFDTDGSNTRSLRIADYPDCFRIVYNYGLSSFEKLIHYDTNQSLTDEQKQTVRTNIGAASSADLKHYLNIDFSSGATSVPSASDYDTLTTPGSYYVSSGSAASAMINCPVTVAHRLYVITTTSSNRCLQLVVANSVSTTESPRIYKRFLFNSWTPWLRLVDEEDIDGLRDRLLQKPVLRNGSIGNKSNTNAICSRYTLPTNGADSITVFFGLEFTYSCYPILKKLSKYTKDQQSDSTDNVIVNYDAIPSEIISFNSDNSCTLDIHDCEAFAIGVFDTDGSNTRSLRIADYPDCFRIVYNYGFPVADDPEMENRVKNARFIPRNTTVQPLTLLHFSDLHADTGALNRIVSQGDKLGELVDDMICTGDMVANSYGQITSWWIPKVMTCIGNHDTASYSASDGYNWTALSMADRDNYYISPFKSNWDIIHTAGTSYYYKDYSDSNVRLIVMDVMLYNDNGAEAADQTTWLNNLLDDAIANNLHVLIAIHAPHDGSTAVECSFSRLNQAVRPLYNDCNTPQSIIDAVASKITSGLHFVGYIIGHTHQDNIWKAVEDGSQLMYCVTCAIVSNAGQWRESDNYRDTHLDAYNLITIDTVNSLIKIIRGGGCDVDNLMRPRKQICFNYSTGQIVGQEL